MHVTVILLEGARSDWLSGGEIRVVLISDRVTQETPYWAISVFENVVNKDENFEDKVYSWLPIIDNEMSEDENVKDKLYWVLFLDPEISLIVRPIRHPGVAKPQGPIHKRQYLSLLTVPSAESCCQISGSP